VTKKARILVVEDEGIVALDISQTLESLGYEVVGNVDTAEEAVEKTKSLQPSLILMDINLKGEMDGVQAAGIINDTIKTPVIFLTAHADEATLQRAKLTQPYGYILKPFESDELRAALEIVLHRIGQVAAPVHHVEAEVVPFAGELASDEGRVEFLRALRLFEKMPVTELAQLAKSASIHNHEGGSSVAEAEEPTKGGFIVLSGRLAVTKASPSGKELTVELLPPGDFWGVIRALDAATSETTIRAQVPSKLLWIPKNTLQLFADRNPAIYQTVLEEVSERLRRSHELSMSLAHSKVEARVISTLLTLAPRIGKKGPDGNQPRIYITRKELADLTGTTPETAIRVTKNLEREGMLDLTRPGIIKIIAMDGLRRLLNEA